MDDIRRFWQLDSKAPDHPEYHWVSGVETTTGPFGQGLATSVGMAMARKWLAARYNGPGFEIFNYDIYAVCGDGCMMEGWRRVRVGSRGWTTSAGSMTTTAYGWPEDSKFLVPDGVYDHFRRGIGERGAMIRRDWHKVFEKYRGAHPTLAAEVEQMQCRGLPTGWDCFTFSVAKKSAPQRTATLTFIKNGDRHAMRTMLPYHGRTVVNHNGSFAVTASALRSLLHRRLFPASWCSDRGAAGKTRLHLRPRRRSSSTRLEIIAYIK